jgi:hypothetical protein
MLKSTCGIYKKILFECMKLMPNDQVKRLIELILAKEPSTSLFWSFRSIVSATRCFVSSENTIPMRQQHQGHGYHHKLLHIWISESCSRLESRQKSQLKIHFDLGQHRVKNRDYPPLFQGCHTTSQIIFLTTAWWCVRKGSVICRPY